MLSQANTHKRENKRKRRDEQGWLVLIYISTFPLRWCQSLRILKKRKKKRGWVTWWTRSACCDYFLPVRESAHVLMDLELLWGLISSRYLNTPRTHCSCAWQPTRSFRIKHDTIRKLWNYKTVFTSVCHCQFAQSPE